MSTATAASQKDPGIVRADECYPLEVFKELVGLSSTALRRARANGLPIKRVSRRKYIRGCDWLEFVGQRPNDESNG